MEQGLIAHIQKFLLELGQGFAFVGRQVHLEIGEDDLESHEVKYAPVGGVAVAFYAEPRFTQDIDLLIDPGRFVKVVGEELMIIDLLLAGDTALLDIVRNALEAQSASGLARVARKTDIIWLKKQRNSLQDQADIERLEHEDN